MVVVGYLILSIILVYLIEWFRPYTRRTKEKALRLRRRNILAALFGLLLTILVSLTILLQPFYGRTLLNRAASYYGTKGEHYFIAKISEAVINTKEAATKIEGIKALSTIHSETSLEQLFNILEQDNTILVQRNVYMAMKEAVASYGLSTKIPLIALLQKYDKAKKPEAAEIGTDIHTNYFKPIFDQLREDSEKAVLDEQRKGELLLSLDEMERELKGSLKDIEPLSPELIRGNTILDFVLDVFLEFDKLIEDNEIYVLAKNVATDSSYTNYTRSRALLLIAKLGSKKDFDTLVPLLSSDDEVIKVAALKAITILHEKVDTQNEKK